MTSENLLGNPRNPLGFVPAVKLENGAIASIAGFRVYVYIPVYIRKQKNKQTCCVLNSTYFHMVCAMYFPGLSSSFSKCMLGTVCVSGNTKDLEVHLTQ